MKSFLAVLGLMLLASHPSRAVDVPSAERERIEVSVRKNLSVLPNWQVRLTTAQPALIDGLYRGTIEFRQGETLRYQNIFISKDFNDYIIGNYFNAREDTDKTRMEKMRLEGAPFLGAANAKETVVQFSDFQCPSCKSAHEMIKADKILKSYAGKIRMVFKNRPFPQSHNWSVPAAVAARCAYRLDPRAFWTMADDLFLHQSSITAANLWDHVSASAAKSKLNASDFKDCYDGKETLDSIQADAAEADALGVNQTPTFFVNGRAVVGYPGAQNFRLLIDDFLKQK